jgi:hypothetical protein
VDAGSRDENATKQELGLFSRFKETRKQSEDQDRFRLNRHAVIASASEAIQRQAKEPGLLRRYRSSQ